MVTSFTGFSFRVRVISILPDYIHTIDYFSKDDMLVVQEWGRYASYEETASHWYWDRSSTGMLVIRENGKGWGIEEGVGRARGLDTGSVYH